MIFRPVGIHLSGHSTKVVRKTRHEVTRKVWKTADHMDVGDRWLTAFARADAYS